MPAQMDPYTETLMAAMNTLQRNEGYRQFVYNDTKGIPTIGYGRNLRDRGVDVIEATLLLNRDIKAAMNFLASYAFWASLNMPRRVALIDLAVNLGRGRFEGFERMLAFLDKRDFGRAADEMLDSLADHEEPARIKRDSEMLRSGEMPE